MPRKTKKLKPKLKSYSIIADAVGVGAKYVTNRLWKYTNPPSGWTEIDDARLVELIENEIMLALEAVIDYE